MDKDEHKRTQMGYTNQLEKLVHPKVNCAMRSPIIRFFMNLGRTRGWKNPRTSACSNFFD